MPQIPERAVRDLADSYVASIAGLDPSVAIALGMESGSQELADLSPAGYQARDDLDRATLAELNRLTSQPLDRSRLARVVIAPSERHRAADGTACAD
jgi:hypothetical protein